MFQGSLFNKPKHGAKIKGRFLSLIRCIAVIIDEIAAHPPDFAEFLAFGAVKGLEWRVFIRVDERVIVIVHVVCVVRVGV